MVHLAINPTNFVVSCIGSTLYLTDFKHTTPFAADDSPPTSSNSQPYEASHGHWCDNNPNRDVWAMAVIVLELGLGPARFHHLQFDTLVLLYALLLASKASDSKLMGWAHLASGYLTKRSANDELTLRGLCGCVQSISFTDADLAYFRSYFDRCWPVIKNHIELNKVAWYSRRH